MPQTLKKTKKIKFKIKLNCKKKKQRRKNKPKSNLRVMLVEQLVKLMKNLSERVMLKMKQKIPIKIL
jgi:hypothetical protein